MNIEIREDKVIVSGYVNAIERYSKPIRENLRGRIRTFIERIKAGVFRTALKRNDNVLVLLNHDHNRILANTKDGSAKLEEDNIGLRAEVVITDQEVVEKARNDKLVGWSFGFYANADELGTDGNNETRTVTDLDLLEVSILDDTKSPAYYGTSIEARSNDAKVLEYRNFVEEGGNEVEEENKIEEEVVETEEVKEEKELDIEAFAELVATKVLEKINGVEEKEEPAEEPIEEEKEEPAEETEEVAEEVEDTAEETTEPEKEIEEENRSIDYSEFEKRISNLN